MKEQFITISAQIPADLASLLEEICQIEERSKSYFVRKALEGLLKARQQENNVTALHKKNDKK
jgi:metal-responsive CopG/Arc/MetJ family transcriptional regulator